MTEEESGRAVIGAAMRVHSIVGPGLLESAYETCLIYELEKQRIPAHRQVLVPIRYEDLRIDNVIGSIFSLESVLLSNSRPLRRFSRCTEASSSAISSSVVSSSVTC